MTGNKDVNEEKVRMEVNEKRIDKLEDDTSYIAKRLDRIEAAVLSIESQIKIILAFIVPILILILGQMIRDPVIYINRYFFFGLAFVSFITVLILERNISKNR